MKFEFPLFAALAVAALAGPPAAAQTPDPATQVIQAMREAEGGAAWGRVHALHMTTRIDGHGQAAEGEYWQDVSTGRYLHRERWPTYLGQSGFDGVTPWVEARSGLAYALGDVDAGLVAVDEAFRVARGWWFPDRRPATIAWVGLRADKARSFDVLQVTPEGGRMFEAWIDHATHRLDHTIEQQAEDRVVIAYADYREVAGLMLPFSIRSGDGEDPTFDVVETIQQVEVDPAIPDSLYALPPSAASDIAFPAGRDSVEVPFKLTADNRILVPLSVEGAQPVDAEFDSGGSLILQPAAVARLGLTAQGASRQMGGGEGSTRASNGRVKSIAIGDATIRDLAFHSYAFSPSQPDLALVGLEVLQRFVVRFDFDRLVMTLTRPDAFDGRGAGTMIPFHFQDNQPEVKGSIDGIAGLFAIDTGDSGSLLLIAPFARRYGLVERYHADLPYGGQAVGATHGVWARQRVGVVALDGADGRPAVEARRPITRISLQNSGFDANRDVSANIGLGILKQFNLTFDYPRQRLFLAPNHLFGQKDVFNRAGLRLKREPQGWSVSTVLAGSPAEMAGLKVGEQILRIDGAATLDTDALQHKLTSAVGTKLELDVKGAAGERHVSLVLHDIL